MKPGDIHTHEKPSTKPTDDFANTRHGAAHDDMAPTETRAISGSKPATDTATELHQLFRDHPPKDRQMGRIAAIQEHAQGFARFIVANTPESSEQAVALAKVDEAVLHACAAIVQGE